MRRLPISFSQKAEELLSAGREKQRKNEHNGAVMLYEKALKEDPTKQQQQEALYNSTCAHAYFGDVEFAQVTLREAVLLGLDFKAALQNPDGIKMQASPQVVIQLRKFAEKIEEQKAKGLAEEKAVRIADDLPFSAKTFTLGTDASDLLRTEINDMDMSILGVVKRVAALLLGLALLGLVLFFAGYNYTLGGSLDVGDALQEGSSLQEVITE